MDSFFSLFDPSDGAVKSNKSKGDTTKGRRRGRKCSGKNETLPEESSFLCEPELSTELLVKDGSYIDSYIEVNTHDKSDAQDKTKPRRRNSGRKIRRKKSKISPGKDSVHDTWNETESETVTDTVTSTDNVTDSTSWNNRSTKPKNNDGNIGKNVNDLKKESDEFKKYKRKNSCDSTVTSTSDVAKKSYDLTVTSDVVKRKNSNDTSDARCKEINSVIDKLEKVGLKDDMYLAGDFNTEDLENDGFYSSEDMDESFDDTTSETDGSAEESYGSLPPEPRFGNVEYKLQLVNVCEKRFQHLVTQLKWRLRSGGGSAVYLLGVSDCGALRGLRAAALRASLATLRAMAANIGAALAHVTARRVQPHRAVAEVILRRLPHSQSAVSELRIAVMGADEAGKSTLVGVLTQGELDNGRGSARLNMFRHVHEVRSGRTSSLSHEILGFDAQGNVVNYGCSELMTAERIGERSAKLVAFLDLAGHSKYQRTTLHGLTGYCPHYAMLVISATAGITSITREHIGVLLALDLPFFCVVTKSELAPPAGGRLAAALAQLLRPVGKKPLLITDENLARTCVAPQPLILDTIDIDGNGNSRAAETGNGNAGDAGDGENAKDDEAGGAVVPIFPVSCVLGLGLSALHAYLLALQPPAGTAGTAGTGDGGDAGDGAASSGDKDGAAHCGEETCEFQIDEIFHVGESSGPVVGGLLASGTLREGDNLLLGPLECGEFVRTSVRSIYRNRVPHHSVARGQSASLGLPRHSVQIRPGMVLLSIPKHYQCNDYVKPSFGGCAPGTCKRKAQPPPIQPHRQKANNSKNSKNIRRKNKNIIQDIAKVEKSLVKIDHIEDSNLYQSDNERNDKKITKKDIYNEVPDITDIKTDVNDIKTNVKGVKTNIPDVETEIIDENDVTGKNSQRKEAKGETHSENCDNEKYSENVDEKCTENVDEECQCKDEVLLEDPNDPRGCMYFQASIHVLRHSTAICPGFQCTVHVGNVRQTAIIEAILCVGGSGGLRCGQSASCLLRWARCPEFLRTRRRLLLTAGQGTRAIGRITQIFPYVP